MPRDFGEMSRPSVLFALEENRSAGDAADERFILVRLRKLDQPSTQGPLPSKSSLRNGEIPIGIRVRPRHAKERRFI